MQLVLCILLLPWALAYPPFARPPLTLDEALDADPVHWPHHPVLGYEVRRDAFHFPPGFLPSRSLPVFSPTAIPIPFPRHRARRADEETLM